MTVETKTKKRKQSLSNLVPVKVRCDLAWGTWINEFVESEQIPLVRLVTRAVLNLANRDHVEPPIALLEHARRTDQQYERVLNPRESLLMFVHPSIGIWLKRYARHRGQTVVDLIETATARYASQRRFKPAPPRNRGYRHVPRSREEFSGSGSREDGDVADLN